MRLVFLISKLRLASSFFYNCPKSHVSAMIAIFFAPTVVALRLPFVRRLSDTRVRTLSADLTRQLRNLAFEY
jgi:hypothetical protein